MLNGVLIKSNNPTFLGKPRTGDVYFERNDQRSFFNYIWKSTMSGLMTTMGFYNKDLREEKRERKSDEKIERKINLYRLLGLSRCSISNLPIDLINGVNF